MSEPLSFLYQFDALINEIGGAIAGLFGEPYDVYRLLPTSTGNSIIDPTSRIAQNVLGLFEHDDKRTDLDVKLPVELLTYTAAMDIIPYLVGDVFVIRSDAYRPDLSIYTLADRRPMPSVPMFVSTPFLANVSMSLNPGSRYSSEATTTVFQTEYGGSIESASIPVILKNGAYAVGSPSDTPADLYVSLQMIGRAREQGATLLPDQLPKVNYFIWIPPLGFPLLENVMIQIGNDQYNTLGILELPTGFYGTICLTEKVQVRAI